MQATIDSRLIWVNTRLHVIAGRTYRLSADGRWSDASIETDADGYPSRNVFQRLAERLRRQPQAPWFALIGAIDRRSETQFVIGRANVFQATASGELTCFANDLHGFYFNNSGSLTLTLKEVEGE